MKTRSVVATIVLLGSLLTSQPVSALEKPIVESFTASKLEVDITDPDLTIDFEAVISHPKGLENISTLLFLTNSLSTTISVPLLRNDVPIDYSKNKVTYRGKLTIPRSLTPGLYVYYIDGVRNNNDNGTKFPTGIINGPNVRELKGAEAGILVRSNGYLNLDYETINGPAFGSQSGISYLNASKFSGVPAPVWKVGETFDPLNYFEVVVNRVEFLISTFTPQICTSNGKTMKLVAEGECHYKVYTNKTYDYVEKSKILFATITGARTPQILKIETVAPLKPTSMPTSIVLSPVYSSGTGAIDYVTPKSITPSICEAGGYVLKIAKSGTCTLTYQTEGNSQFLPSDKYTQNIEILSDNLPSLIPAPVPVVSATPSPTKKTITCVKGNKSKKVSGTNPKCPKGYKVKR
jgi:hypothetical protein